MCNGHVTHDVYRDTREVLGLAPATHRNPRHDIIDKFIPRERGFGHSRFNPTGQYRVRGHSEPRIFPASALAMVMSPPLVAA